MLSERWKQVFVAGIEKKVYEYSMTSHKAQNTFCDYNKYIWKPHSLPNVEDWLRRIHMLPHEWSDPDQLFQKWVSRWIKSPI